MDLIQKIQILNNYLKVKNYNKVIEGSLKILKKIPNNSYLLNLIGMGYQGLNQHNNAIHYFEQSIHFDKKNIAAINNLGNSHKAINDFDLAKFNYEKALELDPNYINAYNNYANLKTIYNDYDGAIKLFKQGIEIIKKNINFSLEKQLNLMFSLASAYHSINKIVEAKKTINEILIIDPKHTSAHKLLSSIIKYSQKNTDSIDHLNKMEELINSNQLDKDNRIDLNFALGKSYDDLKNYEKAFKYLDEANALKYAQSGTSIVGEEKVIKNLIQVFNEIDLDKTNQNFTDKKIIFICGMPRSGTTLTEQIIAAHDSVYGAGELIYLQDLVKQNFVNDGKLNKQKIIDSQLKSENFISKEYFNYLKFYKISEEYITDKAPQNFRLIGFIKLFFPNSKVIHCYRDAKDNCLSLFKNAFSSSMMNWTNRQEDIAGYYNLYSEIMNFWKSKIPNFIHDVKYESLVENKDSEIKKILEFCNLNLDKKCFNHHDNSKTPIKTVSISQARQPIYSSSVNLNSKYDKFLEKMFNQLG